MFMKCRLAVVGLGNIGIATLLALASKGYQVIGLDIDEAKVESLKKGTNVSAEPQLEGLLQTCMRTGRVELTADYRDIQGADIIFITVGSPGKRDGGLDTSFVEKAAQSLGGEVIKSRDGYSLVALKTTVPIGFTRRFTSLLSEFSDKESNENFGVCYSPENLAVGSLIQGILEPEFLVIGEMDKRSGDYLESFYREFYSDHPTSFFRVTPEEGELAKLTLNAYLSLKITFANIVARVCNDLDKVDALNVLGIVGADCRVGPKFIKPGMSYGGQCFPKDLDELISSVEALNGPRRFFELVREMNEQHKQTPIMLAKRALGNLNGKTVAVLGLAYKSGISDVRSSPSLDMVTIFEAEGAKVKAFDPLVKRLEGIDVVSTLEDCLSRADCCLIATSELYFKNVLNLLHLMSRSVIIDGVRLLKPDEIPSGTVYYAIGLGQT